MYAEQAMPEMTGEILAQRMRGGISQGLSAGATLTPSLMASTIKELSELVSQARHTNGTLIETRQRLFGPWPEASSNASQLRAPSAGQAGDLGDVISDLRAVIYETRENAASLASAI